MAEWYEEKMEKCKISEVSGRQRDVKLCKPCFKKDKRTTAVVFCKTCNEFQCNVCSKVHTDFAFMENHDIIKATEADSAKIPCDMKGLDQCQKHMKGFEFFCEDEKMLCCSSCAIVDHRKCHSVVELQSIATKSSPEDPPLNEKLEDAKTKAKMVIKHTEETGEHLNQSIKEISETIQGMKDNVIKMFNDLEASVTKTASKFRTETATKLEKKKTTCNKYISEGGNLLDSLDSISRNGTLSQKFIAKHQLKNQIDDLHANVEKECRNLENVTVKFEFDKTLNLPPSAISDYMPGQLTVKYDLSDAVSCNTEFHGPPMKLEKIASVDLKQAEDDVKVPLYTGLDFLPDGRLVVVDNSNLKCLIYNEKLEKVGSYKLQNIPQGVVVVSEEEVAITSSNGHKIDFLHVSKSNKITSARTCTVKTKYDSICLKDDDSFVVGTVDDTRPARIVSLSGEEKDFSISFPNKKYSLDTSACTYLRNSDKVVLTDRDENIVYIYDVKSNTRVVVKDDQIRSPRGVAVGPYDSILVCSNETDSIVQLSSTGRILSSYKLDTRYPYRVCTTQNKGRLAVSTNSGGNRKLQLFKITH